MRLAFTLNCVLSILLLGCDERKHPTTNELIEVSAREKDALRGFISRSDRIELFFPPLSAATPLSTPDIVLKTESDIAPFVEGIAFKVKTACDCAHVHYIRFVKDKNALAAAICGHCFNIADENRVAIKGGFAQFQMPAVLWQRFSKLERRHMKRTTGD